MRGVLRWRQSIWCLDGSFPDSAGYDPLIDGGSTYPQKPDTFRYIRQRHGLHFLPPKYTSVKTALRCSLLQITGHNSNKTFIHHKSVDLDWYRFAGSTCSFIILSNLEALADFYVRTCRLCNATPVPVTRDIIL